MVSVRLRTLEDRDVDTVVGLYTSAFPFLLQQPESLRHQIANAQPGQRRLDLVAERDGAVVGYAVTSLSADPRQPTLAVATVVVDPLVRRQGIGTSLVHRLQTHWTAIGADSINARLTDSSLGFATEHGFAVSRTERVSHLRLADLTVTAPPVPDGIVVKRFADLPDLRPLHWFDSVVAPDIPADEPFHTQPYEIWVHDEGGDPRIDHANSVVAFDGDRPVAVAWLHRVDSRVWSDLTGTLREYRGRGLAKLVKTAALLAARDDGVTDAYTNNDSTNRPMLAVNEWLGYRPYAVQSLVRRAWGDE